MCVCGIEPVPLWDQVILKGPQYYLLHAMKLVVTKESSTQQGKIIIEDCDKGGLHCSKRSIVVVQKALKYNSENFTLTKEDFTAAKEDYIATKKDCTTKN